MIDLQLVKKRAQEESDAEVGVIASLLVEESERGCAIFGAQIIDERLEDLFRAAFRKTEKADKIVETLFGKYGPLTSISGKTDLATALGFLNERVSETIECVRKIRNILRR